MRESLFFNKISGLRPATLLKKRLWHRCFPMNFVKFLRTPFLQNTSGRLLLHFTFGRTLIKKLMVWSWAPPQLHISECFFSLPHKNWLESCSLEYAPFYRQKCVADILVWFSPEHLKRFQNYLNSHLVNIIFH